jgi:hypothetical protein
VSCRAGSLPWYTLWPLTCWSRQLLMSINKSKSPMTHET